jgi:HD-like signal output (HDOD) protein
MLKPWKKNITQSPEKTQQTALFSDLPQPLQKQFESMLKPVALNPDETLFLQDSPVDAWYFVTKGVLSSESGDVLQVGDWVTDVAFTAGAKHLHSIKALEASALFSLSLDKVRGLPDNLRCYLSEGLASRLLDQQRQEQTRVQSQAQQNQALKNILYTTSADQMDSFVKSETARQLLAKVPRLPVSSQQLLIRLLDEKSTQTEVVDLIRQDPSLTSILLKTINSSAYGFQSKISDINHAISLLGFDSVYQVVMSESIQQSLPDTEFFRSINRASLEISHLAFCLSQLVQVGKPAEFATIGLMSHIGEVVVEIFKAQSPRLASLFAYIDAPAMGAELLKTWGLPEVIYQPISVKNYPQFAEPDRVPEALQKTLAVLYIANVSRDRLYKKSDHTPTVFLHEYMALLGFSDQTLDEMIQKLLKPALLRRKLGLPKSLRELIE